MFSKTGMHWGNKRFRWTALTAIAISFLCVGLLLASPRHFIGPAAAGGPGPAAKETLSMPVFPGSFTDLVQKQGSTVVNIKVTKVEKAGLPPAIFFSGGSLR